MTSTIQELRNSLAALMAHDRVIHQQIEAHYNVLKTLETKDEVPIPVVGTVPSPKRITQSPTPELPTVDSQGHKLRGSPNQLRVIKYLRTHNTATKEELLSLGNRFAVRSAVDRLTNMGVLVRVSRGVYSLKGAK